MIIRNNFSTRTIGLKKIHRISEINVIASPFYYVKQV